MADVMLCQEKQTGVCGVRPGTLIVWLLLMCGNGRCALQQRDFMSAATRTEGFLSREFPQLGFPVLLFAEVARPCAVVGSVQLQLLLLLIHHFLGDSVHPIKTTGTGCFDSVNSTASLTQLYLYSAFTTTAAGTVQKLHIITIIE